ncbi:MAG: argininosuccinate lyase, partial [Candidatus Promineifilaceae bacterium]
TLDDLQEISDLFEEDVIEAFSVMGALNARSVPGGTAPSAVRDQIKQARSALS